MELAFNLANDKMQFCANIFLKSTKLQKIVSDILCRNESVKDGFNSKKEITYHKKGY